ncbi:glycoside hydrolase family 3 protein [Aerococcus kribbianus]|uniref:beta-N-acetylhexosaminidase n=1 Tax=Aerococcus kribbianus TaxID=2999064 RepID=A0A9X3FT34_9LACT|nr:MULTISPECIES: glycoside hydrolase family 3 N-terminal domain-containing protein [unclassified Aerococcus]MCZ0717873.1 beta-hexosaminidase [Aerococcus sp. YH-aer221]MCZ0726160.1 beta-hexosaminidase [Aerococcus sp. YH-aer222]
MATVDLTKQPYNLDDKAIQWVEDTIANMSLDEKIGQLFFNMGASTEEDYLKDVLDNYHIAGVRYNKSNADVVYDQNRVLQENSKIPVLIAANTEAGGDGAAKDGTYIGHEVKIAATNDPKYAYEMGRIAGVEAAAIGCNMSFAPIVDITSNWRNPIISVRTWSNDVDKVLANSLEYLKGIEESNILAMAKHFPGDGQSERDHHFSFAPNEMPVDEWMETYGKIYKGLIDAGLPGVMAGHIALPHWVEKVNPDATLSEKYLPATLSNEVTEGLLKEELGFNGAVITDASHMVALTSAMSRKDALPMAIQAGCDLFLFFNDPDEDFAWMKEGYENGIITDERLHDALRRTLGLKASIGLHEKDPKSLLAPKEEALAKIKTDEHQEMAREVADHAITLVKNEQPDVFPVTPERYKNVLLVLNEGVKTGFGQMIASAESPVEIMAKLMEERGFNVTIWESTEEKIMKLPEDERAAAVANVYAQKQPIANLVDKYDLAINLSKIAAATDQRVVWPASKGTPDIPFYVNEVPVIQISVNHPFALADVPQVQTYINAYDDKEFNLEILVDKLMQGEEAFKGVDPVDSFCGFNDTKYSSADVYENRINRLKK